MTNRISAIMATMAAAFALSAGTAGAVVVDQGLYAGGSTMVEKLYRILFNQFGSTGPTGELCKGSTTDGVTFYCPGTHFMGETEILYVGAGSGNGVTALTTNNSRYYIVGDVTPDPVPVVGTADLGSYYGTGTGSSWVPDGTSTSWYPSISFSASSVPLTPTDVANVAALGHGPVIQIPDLVLPIAIPYLPIGANWTPTGVKPLGGSSTVDLSINTLCGIFNGDITNWNDPEIKADNGGTRLGVGKITVVFRHDRSGATFLLTNALLNQCGVAGGYTTASTHPFPAQWITDNGTSITVAAAAPHYRSGNAFFINVYNAGHLPANFYDQFIITGIHGGVFGSEGVKQAILATPGSIGYTSANFVQPLDRAGPMALNPQTYATFAAGTTPVYIAPRSIAALAAMQSKAPPANTANPRAWGVVQPTPPAANAYPFSGFNFIDLYTCYQRPGVVKALLGTAADPGYLLWFYGTNTINGGNPVADAQSQGFERVPAAWVTAINTLLKSTTLGPNVPGKGACTGIATGVPGTF